MIPGGWRTATLVAPPPKPVEPVVLTTLRTVPLVVLRTFYHLGSPVAFPNGAKEPNIVELDYYARYSMGYGFMGPIYLEVRIEASP